MHTEQNFMHFPSRLLFALLLCAAPIAEAQSINFSTTWFGNSFVTDASGNPKWVQMAITDIWTQANGTVYTIGYYDEAHHELCVYSSTGDKIGRVNDTHSAVSGEALTGNSTHLFATIGSSVRRFSLSTRAGDADLLVSSGVETLGLAASDTQLFVSHTQNGGRISVYHPGTLAFVRSWDVARAGRLSLDPSGNLWVLQRADATTAPRALKFSPTGGAPLATITFAAGVTPTDLTVDGTGRILVTDNGPDQNVKIYSPTNLSGTPTAVSSVLGTPGGVFSTSGGLLPGVAGPGRLYAPSAVAVDGSGNVYVSTFNWRAPRLAHLGSLVQDSTTLQKYSASGAFQWQVFSHEFEDAADVDPSDATRLYTKDAVYTVDWASGQQPRYLATTLRPLKYPHDPRLHLQRGGNNNGGARVRVVNGRKFLYVWDQQSAALQVYRFAPSTDGEVAIPAAVLFSSGSTAPDGWPPLMPADGHPFIWVDRDGDGDFDAGEYESRAGDNLYQRGWHVDAGGNVWKAMREQGLRRFAPTVLANGVPSYSWANSTFEPPPVPFTSASLGDIRRTFYDAATDTMCLTGFNAANPAPDGDVDSRGAGRVLACYHGWSQGDRTPEWVVSLPYAFTKRGDDSHRTPEVLSAAGDYVFVAWFTWGRGLVRVYRRSDGAYVGELRPPTSVGFGADTDIPNTMNAVRRANGEYLVFHSDYMYNKQIVYRWTPGGTPPPNPTPATVDDANTAFTWTGTWSARTGLAGRSAGTLHETSTTGAAAQLAFTGTSVTLFADRQTWGGEADVYLDNVLQGRVSFHDAQGQKYQQAVFTKTGLSSGGHVLRVVAVGNGWAYVDHVTSAN